MKSELRGRVWQASRGAVEARRAREEHHTARLPTTITGLRTVLG